MIVKISGEPLSFTAKFYNVATAPETLVLNDVVFTQEGITGVWTANVAAALDAIPLLRLALSNGATAWLKPVIGATVEVASDSNLYLDSFTATDRAALLDIPTNAEFEARSLLAADYFVVPDYTAPDNTQGAAVIAFGGAAPWGGGGGGGWDELRADHVIVGSFGEYVNSRIVGISDALQGDVEIDINNEGPLNGGVLTIRPGNDYSLAHGNEIGFSKSTWTDLADVTAVKLSIIRHPCRADRTVILDKFVGVKIVLENKVYFEPAAVTTWALEPYKSLNENDAEYTVDFVYSDGKIITKVNGPCIIAEGVDS